MTTPTPIAMYAWIGEDELGSGRIGIKQAKVPAGIIPIVAMDYDREKLERVRPQMDFQAKVYGKRIYLVRLEMVEVVGHTSAGTPWPITTGEPQ